MLNCEWTILNPVSHGSKSLSHVCLVLKSIDLADGSVQIDGVKDPLRELLELGSGALRLFLQPLIVLPKPLNLCLQLQFLFPFLRSKQEKQSERMINVRVNTLTELLFTTELLGLYKSKRYSSLSSSPPATSSPKLPAEKSSHCSLKAPH